jgi:hypothetical protein
MSGADEIDPIIARGAPGSGRQSGVRRGRAASVPNLAACAHVSMRGR